jgi:hypothetical protein
VCKKFSPFLLQAVAEPVQSIIAIIIKVQG